MLAEHFTLAAGRFLAILAKVVEVDAVFYTLFSMFLLLNQ